METSGLILWASFLKHFRLHILIITYFKPNLQYVNFCIYTLYINLLYYAYVTLYTKTRERKTKIEMNIFNIFFSHPHRSFSTPAEMYPAHLVAAGCTVGWKRQEDPFGDQVFLYYHCDLWQTGSVDWMN